MNWAGHGPRLRDVPISGRFRLTQKFAHKAFHMQIIQHQFTVLHVYSDSILLTAWWTFRYDAHEAFGSGRGTFIPCFASSVINTRPGLSARRPSRILALKHTCVHTHTHTNTHTYTQTHTHTLTHTHTIETRPAIWTPASKLPLGSLMDQIK